MFTLERKIYTSVNVFFNSLETRCHNLDASKLEDHNKRFDEYSTLSSKKDIVGWISRMLDWFMKDKWLNNESDRNLDFFVNSKIESVLNNPTLTGKQRAEALHTAVSEFKESINNKPKNQSNTLEQLEKLKQEDFKRFHEKLLKIISDNRMISQESNINIAWTLRKNSNPPADPWSIEWSELLRSCIADIHKL